MMTTMVMLSHNDLITGLNNAKTVMKTMKMKMMMMMMMIMNMVKMMMVMMKKTGVTRVINVHQGNMLIYSVYMLRSNTSVFQDIG